MIQIVISFDPITKEVQVKGPIEDKVFCLGVIEMAKYAIQSQIPSKIVKP